MGGTAFGVFVRDLVSAVTATSGIYGLIGMGTCLPSVPFAAADRCCISP
jgi:hypothetical protein